MPDMVSFGIRRIHLQNASVRIDMVCAILGVVFRYDDGHVFPVGCLRQKFYNPAQGQVIVGHVTFPEWITRLRAFPRAVVLGEHQGDDLRHRFFAAQPFFFKLIHEYIGAELVWDGHVKCRVFLGRSSVKRPRNREIDHYFLAVIFHGRVGHIGTHFRSETEIVEGNIIAFQMVPQRACFVVIFREDSASSTGPGILAFGFAAAFHVSVAAIFC